MNRVQTLNQVLVATACDSKLIIISALMYASYIFDSLSLTPHGCVEDGSKSMIGTEAEDYEGDATLWLDLAAADDGYREYTVLHEFGHVLGLGHEHQMSYLAGAVDKTDTVNWLVKVCNMDRSSAEAKFNIDYMYQFGAEAPEKGTEFDPWSVMCYP